MVFGFDKKREYLPNYSYCNTVYKKRKLFLHLFNLLIQEEVFSTKELCSCKEKTLYEIFMQKLAQLCSHGKSSKLTSFDAKLHHFIAKNKIYKPSIVRAKNSNYQLALKIASFIDNDSNSMKINSDLLFKSFVHKSITSIKRDRVVHNESDCINIYLQNHQAIKVLPFWEKKEKINDAHIQKAIECIKSGECNNIYLVYPREKNFTKHIQIKVPELEGCCKYVIKMIPYSLKTILRN